MYPVSSIHIVYKPTSKCLDIARRYSDAFKSRGVRVGVSTVDDVTPRSMLDKDVVLSIGGDGTLLRVSMMLQGDVVEPLILLHPCGRRNTFYDEDLPGVEVIVEKLLRGDFLIHTYPRGRACIRDKCFNFLNEIAVLNMDMGRVIGFTVSISAPGVKSVYEFEGDGVLVSTVPGSAGYSLSAGGPLVAGCVDGLIVTHLNPMQLGIPSMVLPLSSSNVEVSSRGYAIVYADGEKVKLLDKREVVKIAGGVSFLKIVRFTPRRDMVRIVLGRRRVVY